MLNQSTSQSKNKKVVRGRQKRRIDSEAYKHFYTFYCAEQGICLFDNYKDAEKAHSDAHKHNLTVSGIYEHEKTSTELLGRRIAEACLGLFIELQKQGPLANQRTLSLTPELNTIIRQLDIILEGFYCGT